MNLVDYFQSYKDYFWLWEEDGDVLSIPGGSTIGFRQQVAEILSAIAETGLPPFGSILMVMTATNKTMDDSIARVESIINNFGKQGLHLNQEVMTDAFEFLRIVASVPQEFKIGKRRQILMQTIFADSHNRNAVATSKGIAAALQKNSRRSPKFTHQKEVSESFLFKEVRVVGLLKRRFPTAQAIISAMKDLPDIEEHETLLLEDNTVQETTYDDFVDELMHHPKTFEIAALIKPIWAGFKVPIFNAHPSEQPLGGISDIANKGDFDKLLISEFANDDITFMNRVANNEALYLHREMPPIVDNLHRTILVDVSLKCWGTPKILAFASYIAIAKHPKAKTKSIAYVVGENYVPVNCDSVGEVIDALQQTSVSLHPGKGLASFLEANKQDKALEIFYITTEDALQYSPVQKQLATYAASFKYIITTGADGVIHFYRNKKSGRKHLQTIRLSLDKLWSQKIQVKAYKKIALTPSPDAIPILLSSPGRIAKVLPLDETQCYYVANRCLFKTEQMHASKVQKGFELLLRDVPMNCCYEIGKTANGEMLFLYYNIETKELYIRNLNTQKLASLIFTHWNPRLFKEFIFYKNRSFFYLKQLPVALNLIPDFETGSIQVEEMTLANTVFGMDYAKRQDEIRKYPVPYVQNNVMKNITQVYISESNYLVFNKLRFQANNNGPYFSSENNDGAHKIESKRLGNKRLFAFPDNSTVFIDSCGYIQLKSSNPDIPEVFITSTPDSVAGMATKKAFAGFEKYYNNNLGQVTVTINAAVYVVNAIRIIRDFVSIPLADVKNILDRLPGQLPCKIDGAVAEKMVEQLAANQCIAVIENKPVQKQSIISPEKFYLENIARFIGHIINYEAAG